MSKFWMIPQIHVQLVVISYSNYKKLKLNENIFLNRNKKCIKY